MAAFNAVRFRVKPGREQEFFDAHATRSRGWSGWLWRASLGQKRRVESQREKAIVLAPPKSGPKDWS